jgi:hypothetical protein
MDTAQMPPPSRAALFSIFLKMILVVYHRVCFPGIWILNDPGIRDRITNKDTDETDFRHAGDNETGMKYGKIDASPIHAG